MKKLTQEPQIIILNGTSSAGKTSTVYALRNHLKQEYLHLSSDKIIKMFSESSLPHSIHEIPNLLNIQASSFACEKYNLLIDVVFGTEDMNKLYKALAKYDFFSVALSPPLHTLEAREKERGDRPIGLAKMQFSIHSGTSYHLKINNEKLSPDAVACRIIENFSQRKKNMAPSIKCDLI